MRVLVMLVVLGCGGEKAVEHTYEEETIGWACEELAGDGVAFADRCAFGEATEADFMAVCCGSADSLSGVSCSSASVRGLGQRSQVDECEKTLARVECVPIGLVFASNLSCSFAVE
jgi:hypothetical protein